VADSTENPPTLEPVAIAFFKALDVALDVPLDPLATLPYATTDPLNMLVNVNAYVSVLLIKLIIDALN